MFPQIAFRLICVPLWRRHLLSFIYWAMYEEEFVGMLVLKACCTCAHTQCPWLRQVRSSDEEEAAPLYRKKLNPLLTRWTEVVLFTIAKGQTAQSHRALPYQSPWPWQEKKKKKKDFLVKKWQKQTLGASNKMSNMCREVKIPTQPKTAGKEQKNNTIKTIST